MDAARVPVTTLVPIAELNVLTCPEFTRALRPLFEAAGPLGEALCAQRPFGSYEALLDAADAAAKHLSRAEKVEVVNAHPRIGENAAVVRKRSELSYREQGYASENPAQVATVYEQLRELNQQYEARFGFRFVVFVNRRPKAAIVEVLRQRLNRSPEEELRSAVHDMLEIARDRLQTLS